MKEFRTYVKRDVTLGEVLRQVFEEARRALGHPPRILRFSFTYSDGETRSHELIFN